MDINFDKKSDCSAELSAVVSAAEVQEKKKVIVASYGRNARLAGFRPGKAPASVVAKFYAKEVGEQLKQNLLDAVMSQLLLDNTSLHVLDVMESAATEQEDGSYNVTASLVLLPEYELPAYEGIEVTVKSTEVSDAEVQDTLQKYAEASATYDAVERAAADGDMVVIDFKTTVEGKPTAEFAGRPLGWIEGRDDYSFAIGEDDYIPGLAAGLRGMSAGESKDIVCTLGEDFVIKELAGKDVTFACTVKEVKEKHVPEISAELFAQVLPGKSLDEVREEVRKNLKSSKERDNDASKASQISAKLAEQLSFSLPETLVERELEGTIQRKIYAAIQAGNYEVSKDMDALRADARKETENNLRVFFALQEIAKREHIDATDVEVMQEISRMARQARETNIKSYIRKLQREGQIGGVRISVVSSKVMELLARRAKEVPAPEAE